MPGGSEREGFAVLHRKVRFYVPSMLADCYVAHFAGISPAIRQSTPGCTKNFNAALEVPDKIPVIQGHYDALTAAGLILLMTPRYRPRLRFSRDITSP